MAALLLVLRGADPAQGPFTLPWRVLPRLRGLSLVALVAMSGASGAYRLAPQTVGQPLFLVGEMIAPALMAIFDYPRKKVKYSESTPCVIKALPHKRL
jgi:hypothetical protein